MDSTAHTAIPSTPAGEILALQEAAPGGGAFTSQLIMMVAIFAIFYFLMIRPQQREAKAQQELIGSLQKGDVVVTASGLHGTVWEVRDTEVVLEVAERVRVTIDKVAVKRKIGPQTVGGAGTAKGS